MNSVSRRGFMGGAAAGAAIMATTTSAHAAVSNANEPIRLDKPIALADLNTPALLIDLDLFEANLAKMAKHLKAKGKGLRPHTKTHKCPIIAHKQIALGAIGVCAAKVSEAEVMVDGGVGNVLITSPVVTKEKIDRVIALTKKSAGVQMVIDNQKTATDFNDAAKAAGVKQRVLIDLDTGTKRTGIAPGQPALDLVAHIAKNCPSLQFDGLQAYSGHVMHVTGFEARKAKSLESLAPCIETMHQMEKAGHEVGVFSGGGTGTFDIDCDIPEFTDMQLGSYPFMDVQYRMIGDVDSEVFDTFGPALQVLVTAISQPVPEQLITVDGGYKAFASDSVTPQFLDVTGIEYRFGGDEHGICILQNPSRPVKLGDKLPMIVSHCDPTVNLYDVYHPFRNGKVEELWPIAARGKSQ